METREQLIEPEVIVEVPNDKETKTVIPRAIAVPEVSLENNSDTSAEVPKPIELRRSKRIRKAPERLRM